MAKEGIGIEVKMTNKCDQRCSHCMNEDSPHKTGDLNSSVFIEKFEKWVESCEPFEFYIKEVRMTGGEPLLCLQAVEKIANSCKKLEIPCGINTNASSLTPSVAVRIQALGINLVKISMDATDDLTLQKIRGQNSSLQRIIAGIINALGNSLEVILRFTLCKHNQHQLISCYEMARRFGVKKLQIKPLVRHGRAVYTDAFLTAEQISESLSELAGQIASDGTQPEVLCWPPEMSGGLPSKGCGSIDKIYVATNLQAIICNYVPKAVPIGDLKKDPLDRILLQRHSNIWKSPKGYSLVAGCPQSVYF